MEHSKYLECPRYSCSTLLEFSEISSYVVCIKQPIIEDSARKHASIEDTFGIQATLEEAKRK